jgi:hypothetical protein
VDLVATRGGAATAEILQIQRAFVDEDCLIRFRQCGVGQCGTTLRRRAAGKGAADPLAPLVRAQPPAEVLLLAHPNQGTDAASAAAPPIAYPIKFGPMLPVVGSEQGMNEETAVPSRRHEKPRQSVMIVDIGQQTTVVAGASIRSTGAACPSHFVVPNATVISRPILA